VPDAASGMRAQEAVPMRSDLDHMRERHLAREQKAEIAEALAESAWGWAADFHRGQVHDDDAPSLPRRVETHDDFDF
jgi:hypothetical protein